MATLTERLQWILTANPDGAVKAFEKTGKSAETELGKAEKRLDKLGGQFTKAGTTSLAAAGIMGGALVKAAGSFEDTAIKAGQFADATGLNVDEASRYREVADDLGIGADTLESSLGRMNKTLGMSPTLFEDLGIKIATTKSGATDVNGTFLNTIDRLNQIEDPAKRAAAAAQLFGKGWQGSAELISMSTDDIKARLQSVSDQKVINEEELAKAKQYRDDLDKLKDSAQDLAIAIGQGAAPAIGGLASITGGAVQGVADLDSVTGGLAGSLLAGGTAALGMVGGLSLVAGQVIKIRGRFRDANGELNAFGRAAVPTAAIAGVAFAGLALHAAEVAKHVGEMNEGIGELSRVADAEVMRTFGKVLAEGVLAGKGADETFKALAQTNIEGAQRALEMAEAQGVNRDITDKLRTAIDNEKDARKQADETTKDYTTSIDEATVAAAGHEVALAAVKGATDEATAATDAYKRHNDSMAADVKRKLDEISGKWDALSGNISDDNTWLNLQDDFDTLKTKVDEAWTAASSGAEDAEQKTRDAQIAINDQKLAVIEYGKEVLGLPPEKVTNVLALIDQGSLDEAEALLTALTRNRTMNLSITTKGGAGYSTTPQFAKGGTVPGPKGKPMLAVVHGGEEVISNEQQAAMGNGAAMLNGGGGGGNIYLTVHAGIATDGYRVGQQIVNALNEMRRRNPGALRALAGN